MFRLFTKVQINKYVFNGVVSAQIRKSYMEYTQTATIVAPNLLFQKNENVGIGTVELSALIKRGDPIKFWAGYDKKLENLPLLFEGFVSSIVPGDNIKVVCEDFMYAVKQINVPSQTLTNVTLKELIEAIFTGTNFDIEYIDPDAEVGDWQIDNNNIINPCSIFEKLRQFGIAVFFDGNTLVVGKTRKDDVIDNRRVFIFQHNISSDNLVYNNDEDLGVALKGVLHIEIDKKIKKVERWAFKQGGIVQIVENEVPGFIKKTLPFYFSEGTEAEQIKRMEKFLADDFDRYVFNGYTGSFTTFLEPTVLPREKVILKDLKHSERDGTYKVQSVTTTIEPAKGSQTIELDYKL